MNKEIMEEKEIQLLAYLNGDLPAIDKETLETWIAQSEENELLFREVRKMHELTLDNACEMTPNVALAWKCVAAKTVDKTNNQSYILKIAAVITLVLGLSFLAYQIQRVDYQSVATLDGEIQQITLADGSVVWLNEHSTLEYPKKFDGDLRKVKLSGQAFFEITKNPIQAFHIVGNAATVKVLGTSFDFISRDDFANVNVSTGKVALVITGEDDMKVEITKGQQATFENKLLKVDDSFNANASAWKTKDFVFKSTPMSQVVEVLSNHFEVKIKLDKAIQDCLITSSFEDKNLEEILEVLQAIANIESNRKGNKIHLTGPGC